MPTGYDTTPLPDGVIARPLAPNIDPRGSLVEIYREEWGNGWRVMQFNAVASVPGTLRGMHVHATHFDYIVLVAGRVLLALHDIRCTSATARLSSMTEFSGDEPVGVLIPAGVVHGFYFPERSMLLYGLSRHWDRSDELLCRWDAKEFNFSWPTRAPILSERDATAGSYRSMIEAFEAAWPAAQAARSAGSQV
jgi:dTDP-4-dehydrorhamnose 3,5-epimerase